ncbi:MAG: CHAT domain-containing protein, partial [Gloeobacteraceae cyanobacterium ES-bin-316]|nr:CHAT domain-containing protein [Ferruginibacter sp.]
FLDGYISQLPGAYREAELVAQKLEAHSFKITSSLNEKSAGIIKKLFHKDYKIIHLAGHGVFNEAEPSRSGMVIGNGVFLTTAEIAQMSSVPQFVFVNCCYLGKNDAAAEALYRNRYQLAASIGVQLIRNGVRAVIVAGWAVNDQSALDFAEVFYSSMLGGDNFGDAVKKGRMHCYDKDNRNNTWGAYQCYGDPYYKFDMRQSSSSNELEYVIEEEAEIDLANLYNNLAMGAPTDDEVLQKLKLITDEVDRAGIRNAAITEKEAFIYAQLLKYEQALLKFDDLMKMEKAAFYVSTLEIFCNTKAKKTVHEFRNGILKTNAAVLQMNKNIDELNNLLYISPTAERYNLLGSTYKRKAFVSSAYAQKKKALGEAAFNYQHAFSIAGEETKLYPLINWYLLESIMVALGERKWEQAVGSGEASYELPSLAGMQALLAEHKKELVRGKKQGYSYDQHIAGVNIALCENLLTPGKTTQKDIDDLLMSYRKTWLKIGSKAKKMGEIEQLEIVTDALSASENRAVIKLNKMLVAVKDALIKMLDN